MERLYREIKRSGDKTEESMKGNRWLTGFEPAGHDRSNRGLTAIRSPAGLIPKLGFGFPY
jgi:hypothetical protein